MLRTTSASHLTALACVLSLSSCSLSQSALSGPRSDEELRAIIDPASGASPGARCSALNDLGCSLARRGKDLDRADQYFREADALAKSLGDRAEPARAAITLNHLHLFLTREDLAGLERRCLEAYNEPSPQSLIKLAALAGLGRGLQAQGKRAAGALLTRLAYVGVHDRGTPSDDPFLRMLSLDVSAANRVLERRGEDSADGWTKLRAYALSLDDKTQWTLHADILKRVIQDFIKRPGNGDAASVITMELAQIASEPSQERATRHLTLARAISSALPRNLPQDAVDLRQTIEKARTAGKEALSSTRFHGERRQLCVALATLSHVLQDHPVTRSYVLQARAIDLDEGFAVELFDRWLAAIDALEAQRVGDSHPSK